MPEAEGFSHYSGGGTHLLRPVLIFVPFSGHVSRGGNLVIGIQTLGHLYGLHLQGDFQFNEYPRKYLMSNTTSCL